MTHQLVSMTHADLPGVEKTVTIEAYRIGWWPEGWRSADDPDFTGEVTDDEPPSMGVHLTEWHENTVNLRAAAPAWAERLFTTDPTDCPATAITFEHGQLVLRGSGAGTGSRSDRRSAFVIPGSPGGYSRVLSRWCGPAYSPSSLIPQHGHMHGLGTQADGKRRAVVVWHDILFGAPHSINMGIWETTDGTSLTQPAGGVLADASTFTGGSRTNNVVTLTGLPTGHGFVKDDVVTVDAADNGYDGTFPVASAAATSITYNQTASDDASAGAGTVTLARSVALKQGLLRQADVTASARTSGVVTVTVAAGHPFQVGDAITCDLTDATYDGAHRVTELPSATQVRWRQAVADDADGGTGNIRKILPYWLESEWTSDLVRVRAWPDVGSGNGQASALAAGSTAGLPAGPPPWESAWGTALSLSAYTVEVDPDRGEGCALLAGHLASGVSFTSEVRYDAIQTFPV